MNVSSKWSAVPGDPRPELFHEARHASRLALRDRGTVKAGNWADLAIFDPAKFTERGTVFEPNQLAAGMKHVVVNGVPTLVDGALTGNHAGRILRTR